MADNFKKVVRDIQKRTGWKYTFCRRCVKLLGYEEVSRVVDEMTVEAAGDHMHEAMKGKSVPA